MRIGIVCPYSFDVPGGVQYHVRDLAEYLIGCGHHVSVLAPGDEDGELPSYVVSTGRALPVRYNGSVARLTFGPITAGRVSRWLDQGAFDVIHIHEPIAPSVSILALRAAEGPVVGTFHTSFVRSRAMQAAYPIVRPALEKVLGRIAVSEAARQTLITHVGGDAVVIPNGVYVDQFACAPTRPEWVGTPEAPTVAFVGRIDEPRKGLPILLDAIPAVLGRFPRVRVLVAGFGDVKAARAALDPAIADRVEFLGSVSDADKAALLRSADLYVAPHTGGESFGIVLVEAMSAGTPVLASDLEAFIQVLDGGRAGMTFPAGDAAALGATMGELLADPLRRAELGAAGQRFARRFDWQRVGQAVIAVYETVLEGVAAVTSADAMAAVESGHRRGGGTIGRIWRAVPGQPLRRARPDERDVGIGVRG